MATEPTNDWDFRCALTCSEPGRDQPPTVKIVAVWSNGSLQERKNHGLACERHLANLLVMATDRRRSLVVSDDEQVGRVAAREIQPSPLGPSAIRD